MFCNERIHSVFVFKELNYTHVHLVSRPAHAPKTISRKIISRSLIKTLIILRHLKRKKHYIHFDIIISNIERDLSSKSSNRLLRFRNRFVSWFNHFTNGGNFMLLRLGLFTFSYFFFFIQLSPKLIMNINYITKFR